MLGYIGRVWACRYFWLALVKIDLKARYRRSVVGIGWSLIRPLVMTTILCVVFVRLFKRTDVWTYAPYLLAGLTFWDYLSTAMRQGCQCFFQGESYIRQHPTPIAIFPLRIALAETFHFLIAMTVLIGLAWYSQGGFANVPALMSLIPTLCLLFILVWSVAMFSGACNVYFQDTQHLFDVIFQAWFYATPIVYDAADLGPGRLQWVIMNCNPLVPLLELLREPILYGRIPRLETYGSAILVVSVMAGAASLLCSRLQRRLVFHL